MRISGKNPERDLVEMIELQTILGLLGANFTPEYKSNGKEISAVYLWQLSKAL